MAKWYINSFDIAGVESLFEKLCKKNPLIKEKYEAIMERITKDYAKLIGGEVHARCLILEKDAYTYEDGQGYYGYPLAAEFSDQPLRERVENKWEHRFMLVMYGDEPMDLIEINHCAVKQKAKIYQFPNIKRHPREFFLKDPK